MAVQRNSIGKFLSVALLIISVWDLAIRFEKLKNARNKECGAEEA